LSKQFFNIQTDVRFELEDALEGEDVRDNLALLCVIDPIAGVEKASVDGHERVVEITLQGSVPVGVDDLEGVWVGDRHVVWGEAYKGSCERNEEEVWVSSGPGWNRVDVNDCRRRGLTVFLVQFMNDLRSVTPGSHST
jgi:hypothetical protein